MRVVLTTALCLLAASAAAQDARLVLREAVVLDTTSAVLVDTTGWDLAMVDGEEMALGAVLLAFGEGTLASAEAGTDEPVDAATIHLSFSEAAGAAFAEVTAARVGQNIALVLDGRVLIAPTLREAISGGAVQITGPFSRAEADTLVDQIREATGLAPREPAGVH